MEGFCLFITLSLNEGKYCEPNHSLGMGVHSKFYYNDMKKITVEIHREQELEKRTIN